MVSKKHFKQMADILKRYKAEPELIKEIANWFKAQNSNFNFERFYEACELNETKRLERTAS